MHGDGVKLEIENQKEYIFPEKNEIIATRSTNPRDSANTYNRESTPKDTQVTWSLNIYMIVTLKEIESMIFYSSLDSITFTLRLNQYYYTF